MDVSIIYVNYKTASLVIDSIRSVKEKTEGVEYEVIVVDNDSGDRSLESIKEHYPEVICIQSAKNVGFGRANNLGLEKTTGKSVLFLNPDTLLMNNAIGELYSHLNSSNKIGACGGNLYDEHGNPTTSFSRKFPSFVWEFLAIAYIPPICLFSRNSTYFNFAGKPLSVASIIGADLMVKRDLLRLVGAFDPLFFMNYEETELCLRIRKAGYGIYSVPSARITHLEGRASYIKQSRLHFLYEGQYIYFKKLYGERGAYLIYWITQLKNTIRLLQFRILMSKTKIAYWTMKANTNKQVFDLFKKKYL